MTAPGYVKRARERRPETRIARLASFLFIVAIVAVVLVEVVMR